MGLYTWLYEACFWLLSSLLNSQECRRISPKLKKLKAGEVESQADLKGRCERGVWVGGGVGGRDGTQALFLRQMSLLHLKDSSVKKLG